MVPYWGYVGLGNRAPKRTAEKHRAYVGYCVISTIFLCENLNCQMILIFMKQLKAKHGYC